MSALNTFFLLLGLIIGCVVIAKYRDWPQSQLITRKRVKPEDVRISPALLEQYRQELYRNRPVTVHTAMKQKPSGVKASPQKGNYE